ncbi:cobalamin B12-binding domain protein [Dehalogenimonas lykanthroporepellens BL-DC-9]|nr:cobalamin B12-binding domain protein [Dehalogenimonas lykanthroporepellens BL-DC-9]
MPNHKQIAELIYSNLDLLATEITTAQQSLRSDVSKRHGMDFGKHSANVRQELIELSEAIRSGVPGVFTDKIAWLKEGLSTRGVPSHFIGMNLDAESAALKRYLPSEAFIEAEAVIEAGRRELASGADKPVAGAVAEEPLPELAERFLKTLLAGDRETAAAMIFKAVDDGLSIRDLYLDIFQPCLYEVGTLWHQGKITVAHEHYFSAATQFIMSELYPRIRRQVASPVKGTVVVACVTGELHEIGSRMTADLLEMAGWRVMYLGANTPATAVVDLAREQKAVALALSMALPSSGPALWEIIGLVRRESSPGIRVIASGYILNRFPDYAASFGADGAAYQADEAPVVLSRLTEEARTYVG